MNDEDLNDEYNCFIESINNAYDHLENIYISIRKIVDNAVGFAEELDKRTIKLEGNQLYISNFLSQLYDIIEKIDDIDFSGFKEFESEPQNIMKNQNDYICHSNNVIDLFKRM